VVLNVIGPLTRARRKVHAAPSLPSLYIRIVFHAGQSRELLGVPIRELADRIVPIDEIWPANRLRDNPAGATHSDAIGIVEAALVERTRRCHATPERDARVSFAMRALGASDARVAIVVDVDVVIAVQLANGMGDAFEAAPRVDEGSALGGVRLRVPCGAALNVVRHRARCGNQPSATTPARIPIVSTSLPMQ